jgi:hypothetical protein
MPKKYIKKINGFHIRKWWISNAKKYQSSKLKQFFREKLLKKQYFQPSSEQFWKKRIICKKSSKIKEIKYNNQQKKKYLPNIWRESDIGI